MNRPKRSFLCALTLAAVAAVTPASAQSVAGEWDASINTPGGPRPFKLLLLVHGDTLAGTVKRAAGDVPLTGTVKGDTISFSYTVSYNENALTLTITARVVGDTMKGTVDFAGQASDDFSAKRSRAGRPPDASASARAARRERFP